jgi:hypothetical protein
MNYHTPTSRTPALRMPAQSSPVDRAAARIRANGAGPGLEAASFWDTLGGIAKTVGPTLLNLL